MSQQKKTVETAQGKIFEVSQDRKVGEGGFASVFHAKEMNETPPLPCAGKRIVLKTREDKSVLDHEVKALEQVAGHEAVISLRGVTQQTGSKPGESCAWVFMELADGGELFDRLIDSGNLSERATWPFAKALVEGVIHCHGRGVVHRDIKLENIMLLNEDPSAVKLIDFGLAAMMEFTPDGKLKDELLYEPVGTKSYRAPELATAAKTGYHAPPLDVWSLGITIFSLVSGFFPLEEAKPSDWRFARLADDQKRGKGACDSIYSMYKRACPFSAPLRELLDAMLTIDPARRISLAEISQHPWMQPPTRPAASSCGGYEEDEYSDPIVYRSLGGLEVDDDESMEPFEAPPEAMKISRQKADRGFNLGDAAPA